MKYWIGTVSKEHVLRGVAGGFCQVCHGKAAPLNRMRRGDWLLYYSPKIRMDGAEKLQAFTAFGQITDNIIRTHPEWKKYAAMLRYGHFEISRDFFDFVRTYMQSPPDMVGQQQGFW